MWIPTFSQKSSWAHFAGLEVSQRKLWGGFKAPAWVTSAIPLLRLTVRGVMAGGGSAVKTAWVWITIITLTSRLALCNLLNLGKPQFPCQQNGNLLYHLHFKGRYRTDWGNTYKALSTDTIAFIAFYYYYHHYYYYNSYIKDSSVSTKQLQVYVFKEVHTKELKY